MRIDLHCHSTNSDGTWSVQELLTEAERKKIEGFSITDHDNFKGSLEAKMLSEDLYTGLLVPGIEISTKIENESAHFLAYFSSFDIPESSELVQSLEKIRDSRVWRMKEMISKGPNVIKDFNIDFSDVLEIAAEGENSKDQPTDVLSRPHLARAMIKKGHVQTIEEAFQNYLADGRPLHVARFSLSIKDWVKQVTKAGGILVWAHPLHGISENEEILKRRIEMIIGSGISGVERIYKYEGKYPVSTKFQEKGNRLLDETIAEFDLLVTAGGDFHGDVGSIGELELGETDFNRLKDVLSISQ